MVLTGLDMLKSCMVSKFTGAVGTEEMFDLLGDITSSCNSAVQLLNDLLNYEHIETGVCASSSSHRPSVMRSFQGAFALDRSYVPLASLLVNKLSWAFLVARSKKILFSIDDRTNATEFGSAAKSSGLLSEPAHEEGTLLRSSGRCWLIAVSFF